MRRQAGRIRAWDLEITDKDPLQSGYSGSPVIDEYGYVIGMVSTQRGEGKIGAAISIEALEKLQLEMPSDLFLQIVRLAPIQVQYDAAMQAQQWDEAQAACTEALRLAPEDEGWQQYQAHVRTAQASAELRHRLTDGSYLEKKLREEGVEAVVTELTQGENDEILHNLAVAVRCGTVVLKQAPEEIWNQAKGRVNTALYSSSSRHLPRFDLRFATLFPADEALVRIFAGHTSRVNDCAFSPDGTQMLSVSDDQTLRLWNVASGETLRVFEGPWLHEPVGCAFSPDGQQALSASDYRTLLLWDIASGKTVHTIEEYSGGKYGYAFSPDGKQVLNASKDNTLRLWNVVGGETVRVFAGHTAIVRICAFSPDGGQALSIGDNNRLRLWNIASGETVRDFVVETDAYAYIDGYAFSSDGRRVLCASRDKMLRLWDVASGEMVHIFEGHSAEVNGCAFSPDGRYALSASSDGTLRLWEVANGESIRIFKGHISSVAGCAFSPDGQQALSIGAEMRLWDVAKGKTIYTFENYYSYGCAFSPDGRKALSVGDDSLSLWDIANGTTIHNFTIRRVIMESYIMTGTTCGGAFSPDGRQVIFGSKDGTLRLFDVASGSEVRVLKMDRSSTHRKRCIFSPDGKQVLSAGEDLILWDVARGVVKRIFEEHSAEINGCAFSPDGRRVLSASDDCTLRLWNVASGRELARWMTDTPLLCCAIGPDGETVIAGDNMGGLHFLSIVI